MTCRKAPEVDLPTVKSGVLLSAVSSQRLSDMGRVIVEEAV